jgi:FkbM family methyltransferase
MVQTATAEDIHACFRLILGRQPSPEEMSGHMGLVGSPLDGVVSSYLQSIEFQRRGLLVQSDDVDLVELERFRIFVSRDDALIAPAIKTGYEPDITEVFLKHVKPGMSIIDIGANCGYFSMLGSSLGATVLAFEPLKRNLRMLAASKVLNRYHNLRIVAAAASDKIGTLTIGSGYTNGIVHNCPVSVPAALSSEYVAAVAVDDCVEPNDLVSFLKIDVEGHEYPALMGARRTIERCHPIIVSEFSPAALRANSNVSGRDYLDLLCSWGYKLSVVGQRQENTIDRIIRACEGRDHVDILAAP